MSIVLEVTEVAGAEVLVGAGSSLQLTVQETVGGVVHPVAGAEITVLEQTAVSQAVVIETGVSTASLSDLLMIRADTEAARADAEASEATALAHKNAAAVSEANADASEAAALAHKNAAAISEVNADASEAAAIASKNAAALSESNADASEAAALASKNAAAASEAAALASKNAAAVSESNALAHKNAAALSETNADASEAAALASKNAAAASEAAALASKNAAAVSEAAALASKNAAALSETNADASEAAALASKNAAAISEANAGGSATSALASKNAAAISETNAGGSATSALASKNAAATSETNALAHKNAAAASEANALSYKNSASTSEVNALSYKNAAGASATAAGNSAAAAALSETNAGVSETAAAASAAQAQQYATIVASALIFRGGWSAAGGVFPTPNLDPETSDYYRITVGGTMTGGQGTITVTAGDFLHWDMNLDQWFKVDAVDAVTSVSGRTGDVTLSKTDVGLANVQNVDQTNASNITSGTLAVSRLAASVWHAANLPVQTDGVNVTVNNNLYLGGGTLYGAGKSIITASDSWLRLNPGKAFTDGIYLNGGVTRTDGVLQVGEGGYTLKVTTGGNAVFGSPRVTIGDGNDAAAPNGSVISGMEHYLEIRGTQATYPSKNGLVFHQEGISTSALVHGNTDDSTGYFDLVSDDPNLSVRFGGEEVWNSTTGPRGNQSAAGVLGNTADWNSFDRHGTYHVQQSTFDGSNGAPPAVYPFGVMVCDVSSLDGEQRRVQVYYPHNQDTDKYIYQRMRNAGVWTAWCSIWRGGTGYGSGLVAAKVDGVAPTGEGRDLVWGQMAGDDFFRLRVYSSAYDGGAVEIATADGGNEPIYVRQYTGGFVTVARTLTLLDAYGVTKVPVGVDCTNGYGGPASGTVGNGICGGNGDNCTSTMNNLKVAAWWGLGFGPSVSGQAVPYGQYSHWFNTRTGSAGMRGALSQNSDIRLKENVEVITDALAKTCSLRGIVYDRKDGGGRLTGVVAQEVQAVLPEAVAVAEDELQTLSVAYGNMVGLLIEAIKELKAEVDTLKTEVAALKAG